MAEAHFIYPDELEKKIREHCAHSGMSMSEFWRRSARLYLLLSPAQEIALSADMSQRDWDLIKWRVEGYMEDQRKEQGE